MAAWTGQLAERRARTHLWAAGIIALAALLRFVHLSQIPSCLEYDEAANVILAGEIARGQSFPVFIRPYTGKEVLYFYLAAGMIKLVGITPLALRLTSAFLGVLNVSLTYWFARELFATNLDERVQRWLPLFSAALVAVSYWQVNLSRFGYRAIVLPPLLALTVGSILRGLRSGRWSWFAAGGAWAGLAAYTYSSVRVLPILLLLFWVWVLIASHGQLRMRLFQLLLFGFAAAVVFAPLGIFFLRYPDAFSVRLAQVSVFSPAVNRGDLWGTLWRTGRLAFGMFTVSGDVNPLYNYPGKPVFGRVVGTFFYLGLAVCAWRSFGPLVPAAFSFRKRSRASAAARAAKMYTRLPTLLLLAWLLVMMIPNVLSASGVPHNLRAMALLPAVYVVAALGIVTAVLWAAIPAQLLFSTRKMVDRPERIAPAPWWDRPIVQARILLAVALLLVLGLGGVRTYHDYARVWARSAGPYYKGNTALIRAADLLNQNRDADPYVATYFYQHATLALHARDYGRIRWMGGGTVVLPPPDAPPAILIYDHTNPVDPVLGERYLRAETLFHRELGPDGGIGFEAYRLDGENRPVPAPRSSMNVNLGHTLTYLGYDLNAPARSGGTFDVTLYFKVLRAVDRDDLTFFAHLVDDLGFRWAEQTFFHYPPAQWRPGEVVITRLQLPIAPGAPPGAYALDVGVFSPSLDARLPVLNEAGQMVGTVVSTEQIQVLGAIAPPSEVPAIQSPQEARFGDALVFLGSDRDRSDLLPGQTLALTLYWQAARAIEEDYVVSVQLSGPEGEVSLWGGHPVHGLYPFSQWQPGEFIRDRYALRLPLDTPAGDLDLRLSLLDAAGRAIPVASGSALSLGTIHVRASDRVWEPPAFEHPVGARLGDAVELLGYDLDRDRVRPGETLYLTLVWRCRETMDTAYTVFTHLLDDGEQVRGQKDNPPVNGSYPTTLWVPGEVVVDRYEIPVDADAAPGVHVIEVGMYDPASIQRLPVLDATGATGDRILVAEVEVTRSP